MIDSGSGLRTTLTSFVSTLTHSFQKSIRNGHDKAIPYV